jgi:hypothetical protein
VHEPHDITPDQWLAAGKPQLFYAALTKEPDNTKDFLELELVLAFYKTAIGLWVTIDAPQVASVSYRQSKAVNAHLSHNNNFSFVKSI